MRWQRQPESEEEGLRQKQHYFVMMKVAESSQVADADDALNDGNTTKHGVHCNTLKKIISVTAKRNGVQGNGHGKKVKDEFVLERKRSARYSPNNIDNGHLRFYLTPIRGSRRDGSVKNRSNQAHSIARSEEIE